MRIEIWEKVLRAIENRLGNTPELEKTRKQ
jgi:hypothetical protein